MRKKYALWITILVLAISVLTGLFVYQYMKDETSDFEEDIVFSLDGATQKTLSVTDLNMVPGQKKECKITLNASEIGDYVITVAFQKKSDGTLDKYLDAEISVKDNVQTRPLDELFLAGDNAMTFTVSAGKSEVLTITYIMPETVGDEAQGTACSFDVVLKVELAQ